VKWALVEGIIATSDKEIIFNNTPSGTALLAAPVKMSGTIFESGVPQRLFRGPIFYADVTTVSPIVLKNSRCHAEPWHTYTEALGLTIRR
jgi:hypothetical protein